MGEERHNNQPQKGGGVSVVRTAATTTTVGTVPLPTMDCGATTADDGSNRGGSRDHGKAKTAPRLRRGERYCQHYDVDKMTREQTLALASAPAAIARYPLPKRVAPREFRHSAEGEDNSRGLVGSLSPSMSRGSVPSNPDDKDDDEDNDEDNGTRRMRRRRKK